MNGNKPLPLVRYSTQDPSLIAYWKKIHTSLGRRMIMVYAYRRFSVLKDLEHQPDGDWLTFRLI